jgi:hypothetical protein
MPLTCSKPRPLNLCRCLKSQYSIREPFKGSAIDIAGPSSESYSGNKNLLIAMDNFTKWPKFYFILSQGALMSTDVPVSQLLPIRGPEGTAQWLRPEHRVTIPTVGITAPLIVQDARRPLSCRVDNSHMIVSGLNVGHLKHETGILTIQPWYSVKMRIWLIKNIVR